MENCKTDAFYIRTLKDSDDLSELIALSKSFFYEYEAHHEDFFKIDNLCESDVTDYFLSFIDSDKKKAFIAILDNKVVGYITVVIKKQPPYWHIKKVGDISGLMVQKEYRHRGIASQLLKYAMEFFKEKNVKYYTLFTSVNNHDAIAFYKKCGMEPLYTTLVGDIK